MVAREELGKTPWIKAHTKCEMETCEPTKWLDTKFIDTTFQRKPDANINHERARTTRLTYKLQGQQHGKDPDSSGVKGGRDR